MYTCFFKSPVSRGIPWQFKGFCFLGGVAELPYVFVVTFWLLTNMSVICLLVQHLFHLLVQSKSFTQITVTFSVLQHLHLQCHMWNFQNFLYYFLNKYKKLSRQRMWLLKLCEGCWYLPGNLGYLAQLSFLICNHTNEDKSPYQQAEWPGRKLTHTHTHNGHADRPQYSQDCVHGIWGLSWFVICWGTGKESWGSETLSLALA